MIERGATHIGVATDHIVESFERFVSRIQEQARACRRSCLSQFPILEEALESNGAWSADGRLLRPMMRSPLQPIKQPGMTVVSRP